MVTLRNRHLTVTIPSYARQVNPDRNVDPSDASTNTVAPARDLLLILDDASLRAIRRDVLGAVSHRMDESYSNANILTDSTTHWSLQASIEHSALKSGSSWQPRSSAERQGKIHEKTYLLSASGVSLAVTVLQKEDQPETSSHTCVPAYHRLIRGGFMPGLKMINRATGTGYDFTLTLSSLLLTTLAGSPQAFLSQTEASLLEQMAVSALVTIHRLFNRDQEELANIAIEQTFDKWFTTHRERIEYLVTGCAVDSLLEHATADEIRLLPTDYSTVPADVRSTNFTIRCPSVSGSDGPQLTLVAFPGPCDAEKPKEDDSKDIA